MILDIKKNDDDHLWLFDTVMKISPKILGKHSDAGEVIIIIGFDDTIPERQLGNMIPYSNTLFSIKVRPSRDRAEMVKTIAHELQHVRQYADGKLKRVYRKSELKGWRWKGKYYKQDFPYKKRPWEIEARKVSSKFKEKV